MEDTEVFTAAAAVAVAAVALPAQAATAQTASSSSAIRHDGMGRDGRDAVHYLIGRSSLQPGLQILRGLGLTHAIRGCDVMEELGQ
jgi:hypothetical protein